MKLNEFRQNFRDLLYEACHSYVEKLKNDLKGEKIYAFAINMSDTWNLTSSTLEYLAQRREKEKQDKSEFKEPNFYLEIAGAEWCYFGKHEELFISVNDQLTFLNSVTWGEAVFEDVNADMDIDQVGILIRKMVRDIIINVMSQLKQNGLFNNDSFVDDIYLGVQYSDPSESNLTMLKEISQELNSDYWNSKVEEYLNFYL